MHLMCQYEKPYKYYVKKVGGVTSVRNHLQAAERRRRGLWESSSACQKFSE